MTTLTVEEFFRVNEHYEERRLMQNNKQLKPLKLLNDNGAKNKVGGKSASLAEMYFDEFSKMGWFSVAEVSKKIGLEPKHIPRFSKNLTLIALSKGYKVDRRTVYKYGKKRKSAIELKFEKA